ncbi:MAG: D-alanyl-D-alanine carboxypeptidase [Clostridia bacterium]|nr:D-alanyl-D-alanine carboxypeptidase [Clostridia bacterium]
MLFSFGLNPFMSLAVDLEIDSASAILIEANSGKILYEKNAHERRAPASVTKLMTLLVAIEAIKDGRGSYDDVVIASENAWRLGGSQIWLEPGEKMTLKELLIAIAVGSANDACVAVAEHLYGSQNAFVEVMNQRAQQLGLKNTHFVNPYGLPAEEHYTSAYDMAQIGREALKHEEILQLTSIKHYRLREDRGEKFTQLDNTNKLLWWYPGTDGFKTGWIGPESGYCLASTVERDGLRLIAVVLGAPQVRGNFKDSMTLYNYGFATYQFKEFLKKGQEVSKVKVGKGDRDYITAITNERVGIMVPKGKGEGLSTKIEVFPIVEAPVSQGQVVGKVTILKENEPIEEFELIAKESVKKGSLWREYKKLFSEIINFD